MSLQRMASIVSLAALSFLVFAAPAQALLIDAQDELVLNEFITSDVYLAGNNVTVEQDVEGDVLVGGGNVVINGDVTGDLMIAAGNVILNGQVSDDVRVLGGAVSINDDVAGDLVLIGGDVELDEDSEVLGDVVLLSGSVNLYGDVNRSVRGLVGRLTIGGRINGDVNVRATEKLILSNGAEVAGDVTYFSPRKMEDYGGTIEGEIAFNETTSTTENFKEGIDQFLTRGYLIGKLWSLLSLLLIGMILAYWTPNFLDRTAIQIRQHGFKAMGVGFLVFVLGGVASVIGAITLVGMQLSFIVMALLFVLGTLGRVVAGHWLGSLIFSPRMVKGVGKRKVFRTHFLALLVGLTLLKALSLLPFLGWLVGFITFLIGAGGIVMVKRATYRHLAKEKLV